MDDIKKILIAINSNPSETLIDDNINRSALHEQLVSLVNDTNNKFNKFFDFEIIVTQILLQRLVALYSVKNDLLFGVTFSLPGAGQNVNSYDPVAEGNVRNFGTPRNSGDNKEPPPGDPNTNETLQNLIGRLESGNDYIRTKGLLTDPDIIKQTVEQNREKYNNRALGRYQIQYQTFKDNMGTTNLVFSPETQDKAYEKLLINRGKLNQYLNGGISIEKFAFNLSTVWAALPKDDSNKSYYEGDKSGNRSLVNWPTFLKTIRNSYPNVG